MKELSLKSNSVTVTPVPTLEHLRLTISWSIPAAAIAYTRTTVSRMYNPRAVTKNKQVAKLPWDELLTISSADRILKFLLELCCHIYNNDEHTKYYDPTLQLAPVQAPPQPTKPEYKPSLSLQSTSRYSDRPDLAKLVTDQIEADKQWEQNHAKNT